MFAAYILNTFVFAHAAQNLYYLSFTKFTARAAPFFSSFYHFLNENYKIFSIFKWLHFSGAGQIDEGELGFHLQWQKEYVLKLIEIVPLIFKRGTEIQLIYATHSPISLSDLPNEHITFLKKDDNRNAIVQDQMDKSTFSANIHDILKNSFFLTDGFMGSFAQHKINGAYFTNETRRTFFCQISCSRQNHSRY